MPCEAGAALDGLRAAQPLLDEFGDLGRLDDAPDTPGPPLGSHARAVGREDAPERNVVSVRDYPIGEAGHDCTPAAPQYPPRRSCRSALFFRFAAARSARVGKRSVDSLAAATVSVVSVVLFMKVNLQPVDSPVKTFLKTFFLLDRCLALQLVEEHGQSPPKTQAPCGETRSHHGRGRDRDRGVVSLPPDLGGTHARPRPRV